MASVEQLYWRVDIAAPEDAAEIAAMQARNFKDTYYRENDPAYNNSVAVFADAMLDDERIANRTERIMQAMVNDDEELYLNVKTLDQASVGMLYGYSSDGEQEIVALYVDKSVRGRGMGRALVERFIAWSDAFCPIEVGVETDNFDAQEFYRRLGFELQPDSEHDFDSVEGMKEIMMVRKGDMQ